MCRLSAHGRELDPAGRTLLVTCVVRARRCGPRSVRPRRAVWASPEWAWLCANAERFGFVVPRNAMPEGMRCGGVIGNGAGGCIGGKCGYFESWHVEAVGVAITHPDFAGTMSRSGQA